MAPKFVPTPLDAIGCGGSDISMRIIYAGNIHTYKYIFSMSDSSEERELHSSEDNSDMEEMAEAGTDGFANVLNKILNQDIGNKVR